MDIPIEHRLKSLLETLELELKSLKLWQVMPPCISDLSSNAPFCCDTLAFEQWLQFIFIPRITQMINHRQTLPSKISLTPMAEESFKFLSIQAEPLLEIIHKIDQTLTEQGQ